jgi:ubiquinone/menaquinone biosynthesis C-methylase UbiE
MFLEEANETKSSIIRGVGESIPVSDDSVDLVISYEVLEHVQDPELVFKEVARVLRRDGVFHFTTPNYMSFREPHYKVFWLPLLPKIVGRLYLRLLGRDPAFINHINYVNPINIRWFLRRNSFTYIDLRYEMAVLKVKEIIKSMFPARGFLLSVQRLLMPLLRAAILVLYIGFLNIDQEFLAYKVR